MKNKQIYVDQIYSMFSIRIIKKVLCTGGGSVWWAYYNLVPRVLSYSLV